MAAGLRNGSAYHGMRFVVDHVRHSFEPGVGDSLRDRIVAHAGHRHRTELARQLRDQLSGSALGPRDANAYLALLGHFEFAGFDQLILDVWRRHQDEVLAYAIWAAARCPMQDVDRVIGPMINRLAALPVREDYTKSPSERESMTLYIGWGFRRGVSPEALTYLLEAGKRDQLFRQDISLMVEGVDCPDAVEFLVRHLAEGGGSNMWSHLTGIGDGEPAVRRRSPQATDRLCSLWQSAVETEKVRTQAFCLWLQMSGCKDSTLLATVAPGFPFYHHAVQHRIKLGDSSVVPDLLRLLRSDELGSWWWVLAHRVWCKELALLASETLAKLRDTLPTDFSGGWKDHHWGLTELMVKIPARDAEDLLQTYWGHLKYIPRMVHAAFRIGTPKCVALAREALEMCPANADIFRLFGAIWTQRNASTPISLRHLENLEPHFNRMSGDELASLARDTERTVGYEPSVANWIRVHIVPRMSPTDRQHVRVADETFLADLDHNLRETCFEPHFRFAFEEEHGQTYVSRERHLPILDEWLSKNRTLRGLEIAAECLKHLGARPDLDLLRRYAIEGDTGEIKRIIADTKFSIWKRTLG